MKVDINGVSITLTTEQLDIVSKHINKGKEFDYRDIKSFDDACNHLKIDIQSFYRGVTLLEPDELAYKKLKIIVKAINNRWIANWNDTNEKKWYPYFDMRNDFTFCGTTYYWSYANSFVGSRLCLETEAKAKYLGTTFLDEYRLLLS